MPSTGEKFFSAMRWNPRQMGCLRLIQDYAGKVYEVFIEQCVCQKKFLHTSFCDAIEDTKILRPCAGS